MKSRLLIVLVAAVCVLVYLWKSTPPAILPSPGRAPSPLQVSAVILPGEKILTNYGDTKQLPEQDLTQVSRLLANFQIAAKAEGALPLGSNAEMAAAIRGEGRVKMPMLPKSHRAFDAQGRLIDRWGTPFFFHVESAQQIAIRSAGPDRELWTNDDLHRNSDGHFRSRAELNPPSLVPEK